MYFYSPVNSCGIPGYTTEKSIIIIRRRRINIYLKQGASHQRRARRDLNSPLRFLNEKSWFSGVRDYLGPYLSIRKDFFIAPFFLPFLAILWLKNVIFSQKMPFFHKQGMLCQIIRCYIDNQMHLTHFQLFLWLEKSFFATK